MTAKFDWDNAEQTVGRYDLTGNWTWDELDEVMDESWAKIAKRDVVIDSILIFENRSLPPNAMPHLRKLATERPANTGILVAIGAGIIQRSVVQVFTRAYSSTLRREVPIMFADSLDEARQILAQKRVERGELPQTP